MINENIERKKQFCGGSLFVTKSQLQSSTLQKNEVLHWYFRDFSEFEACLFCRVVTSGSCKSSLEALFI